MSDEIQRSLGRIEGKIDLMLDTQSKHSERLDVLDAAKNRSYGAMAAIGVLAGAMGGWAKAALAALFHSGQP